MEELNAIKIRAKQESTINPSKETEQAHGHVQNITKSEREETIGDLQELMNSLVVNITSANDIIKNRIIPSITSLLSAKEQEISGLIVKFSKNPQQFMGAIFGRKVLHLMDLMSSLFSFLGSMGASSTKSGQLSAEIRNQSSEIEYLLNEIENDVELSDDFEKPIIDFTNMLKDVFQRSENVFHEGFMNKSNSAWDLRQLRIQNSLEGLKQLSHGMIRMIEKEIDFRLIKENLDEVITMLIDMYDNIDSYAEKLELSSYVEKIQSFKPPVSSDSELDKAILELFKSIEIDHQYKIQL